jgi:FKBP-type peptidyl-prolyl cis-trans isomerase FkpA
VKAKLIVALLAACLLSIYTYEVEGQTKRGRARRSSPAATSPAPITTPSGLTYLITKKGTGPQLNAGDTVTLNYTGTLTDGVKFDSSHDRQQPLEFKLGAGRVIKGWDEGVAKLHVGDHAILVIPGKLAYGAKGVPGVIPPDATLIFVIEVIGVKANPPTDARIQP